MINHGKSYSKILAPAVLFLLCILALPVATASEEQNNFSKGPYAYITNSGSNTVSVIDIATDTVVSTINVGNLPTGVAVNSDGTKAYVANENSNNLSVINTSTNTIVSSLDIGLNPRGVAVDPENTHVFVTNYKSPGDVSVIHAITNSVSTIPYTVYEGNYPAGAAINPEGTTLYVTNQGSDTLSIIKFIETGDSNFPNNGEGSLLNNINVGRSPCGIAIRPDGTCVYVANGDSNTVSVINTSTGNLTATIDVGKMPQGIALTPDGKSVYVSNFIGGTVSIIDTTTNVVADTVQVGRNPIGVSVNPNGTKIYVANYGSNSVSVIDTATNTVITTVPVGSRPVALGQFIIPQRFENMSAPVADFSSEVVSIDAFLTVHFTDSSENATEWYWDFGDGTNSIEQSPSHVYAAAGTYNVSLRVSNLNGKASKSAIITVSEPLPVPLIADFSSDVTSGYPALTVQFIDLSTGTPNEWYWDFGDGEYSGLQNPVHTYYEPGNYTIKLDVSNPEGNNSTTKIDYIQVKAPSSVKLTSVTLDPENSSGVTTNAPGAWTTNLGDPLAQIAVRNDKGILLNQVTSDTFLGEISVPLAPGINNLTLVGDNIFPGNEYYGAVLFFNGVSTLPQIAVYNSNTGSGNFSAQSKDTQIIGSANGGLFFDTAPGTSVYIAQDGTKVEVLSFVIDSINGTTDEISWGNVDANGIPDTIAKLSLKVTLPPSIPVSSLVADFSAIPNSGTAPLSIRFADNSTGRPNSWYWDFGDGTNDLGNPSPEHTYTVPGIYNVTLTVTNENDTASKSAIMTVSKEQPLPILPATNLSSNTTSGYAPLDVQIVSLLENATGVSWDFGDGNNSFANLTLEHLFSTPGTYNFTLKSENENGTSSKVIKINVLKPPVLPVANFESNATSGSTPLIVQFKDLLDNTTERYWDFGDGTNSSEQSPVHTYIKAGKYTVSLTARNVMGINTVTKYNFILVANGMLSPVAAFSASPTEGNVPLNVSFTDSSIGSPTLWKWNFGDGTNSTEQNPTHIYTKAGQYTVTLTANNAVGSNMMAKYSYINAITVEKAPVTIFSAFPTSGSVPLNVSFIDNSTSSPAFWKWNFGDGGSSTEQNPVHLYNRTGKFNVTLTTKNAVGSNAVTKSGYIIASKAV